jgi:cytochrome c
MKLMTTVIAAGIISFGFNTTSAFASPALAASKGCVGCHSVDKKLVGPAYQDIAAKYANQKGADAALADKIMKGGAGVWGPAAMPPNAAVSAADALTLAKWVLSGAK